MFRGLKIHHLALFSLLILFILALGRPIGDTDFWWHLKVGEFIWDQGFIPRTDPFSFASFGQPWITHEWLAEVIYYLAYQVGGFYGLTAANLIILGIIYCLFFLVTRLRTGRPYMSAILTIAAALMTMVFWVYRPHLMGYMAFLAFFYILEKFRSGPTRLIWILPVVMIFWVNVHGSYIMGLVLIGLYLSAGLVKIPLPKIKDERWSRRSVRDLSIILALSFLASFLNPNTYKMVFYPFFTVGNSNIIDRINEWASPDFHQPVFLIFLFVVMLLWGLAVLYDGQYHLTDLMIIGLFSAMAFFAVRNIALFTFACFPVMGYYLTGFLKHRPEGRQLYLLHWLAAAAIAVAIFFLWPVPNDLLKHQEESVFPIGAVRFLNERGIEGTVFNDYNWGGYLLWHRHPLNRVFIDGRTDIYAAKIYPDYLKIMKLAPAWSELLNSYRPELVLLKTGTPLAGALAERPEWSQIFADDVAVLYRRSPEGR